MYCTHFVFLQHKTLSMKKVLIAIAMMATTLHMSATDYYMSTTGLDSNDGKSRETAFATLGAAQKVVQAGDNVYILPGTYTITESQISKTETPYKILFNLNHQGKQGQPISFIGLTEGGQRPVFDLSQVNPAGYRVTAFYVTGCYMVFRNFEVVGIKVNITDHTQSENFRIRNGYRNTFDNIACHDGMGIGFYLTNNSHHNLFLNCDGYNNYDPVSESGKGGQNDAFGCHVQAGNEANIFIGCRAWNNSDDGYDLINCYSPVTICYSIAFKNGYDADGTARQDGNGFKAGGYGMSASEVVLPEGGAPRHVVNHCLAVQNKSNGIYTNHHLGGVDFTNNTAVDSRYYSNFAMVNRKGAAANQNTDVNGYGHNIKNNLSVSQWNRHIGSIDVSDGQNTVEGNSFTWDATAGSWVNNHTATFVSTNTDRLKRSRLADGMLAPATTLTVYQQTSYTGMGCDFSGYEDAVKAAKKISGAEKADVENTYINETTTWDFSDLSDGTIEEYTDYNGLILRATAGTHAVTTKTGSVSFAANGSNIETSYLTKNKQAADDLNNTTYDRCLAFNASVAGKTTATFSGANNNDRRFQILFKAKDKAVVKSEVVATKAQSTISLVSEEAGTFFIAATIACNVHEVKFEAGATDIRSVTALSQQTGDFYDLLGRRVGDNPQKKGIYIRNGRKYIKQ